MHNYVYVIGGTWCIEYIPDSKVHGANMGPVPGRQDRGGPHVGPMNFANWDVHHFPQSMSVAANYVE